MKNKKLKLVNILGNFVGMQPTFSDHNMEVFKFGGASLQNSVNIHQFGTIINRYQGHCLVIVVSAMGKVTSALETILEQKIQKKNYEAAVEELYTYHLHILQSLFGKAESPLQQELINFRKHIVQDLQTPYKRANITKLYSQIVSWGEIISSRIIYYYLLHIGIPCTWVDARTYIKTNEGIINAQVDQELTHYLIHKNVHPLFQQSPILLTQGFIGSNAMGHTTTLGKESSDYTGAILAATLGATSLTLWKDVPGIMNADPKIFQDAIHFKELSYRTMFAMSFYGAQVVHPKTIYALALQNIPLYIKPMHDQEAPGTLVSNRATEGNQLPIYIVRSNQVWMKLQVGDFIFFEEKQLAKVLEAFDNLSIRVNYLEITPFHISICLTYDYIKLAQLLKILQPILKLTYQLNTSLLTIMNKDQEPSLKILEGAIILTQKRYESVDQIVFCK